MSSPFAAVAQSHEIESGSLVGSDAALQRRAGPGRVEGDFGVVRQCLAVGVLSSGSFVLFAALLSELFLIHRFISTANSVLLIAPFLGALICSLLVLRDAVREVYDSPGRLAGLIHAISRLTVGLVELGLSALCLALVYVGAEWVLSHMRLPATSSLTTGWTVVSILALLAFSAYFGFIRLMDGMIPMSFRILPSMRSKS